MSLQTNYWTRRSPFFEGARRAGAGAASVANHMYQPHSYADPLEEYGALIEGVTLWDVGTERQVEITGPDALAFMELLTPRSVAKVPVGRARYSVITDEAGGIVNDPLLLRLAENHFWLSISDSDLLLWARGVAVFAGMDVTIREAPVSPVQIQGPKSPQVLAALFGEAILALPFYAFEERELDGLPLVVSRTGWSSEVGYELFLRDESRGDALWDRVLEAGRPFGITVTGPSDISRVEAGILGYGSDIFLDVNPFEAGLGWMMTPEKPQDFIGKAALARIRAEGPRRRIMGLGIEGPPLPVGGFEAPWPVLDETGTPAGQVTVALHSPRLDRNIGFAMLQAEQAESGTSLTVESPFGNRRATVETLPFLENTRRWSSKSKRGPA